MLENGKRNDPLAARRQGVQKTQSELGVQTSLEPQRLVGVMEAKVVFVQYTNAKSELEMGMYFDVGGKLISTNDTAAWCRGLHPMADWLLNQVKAERDRAAAKDQPLNLATEDKVDVL